MPLSPVATDDFNRADGALGSNWAAVEGTPLISTNQFAGSWIGSAGNVAIWAGAGAFASAQYAQVIIDFNASTDKSIGVCVRGTADASPNQDYYICSVSGDGAAFFEEQVNGTYAAGNTTTGLTIVDGDEIRHEIDAFNHQDFFINDVSVLTDSDASLSGGKPGLGGYAPSGTFTQRADTWEGGDLTGVLNLQIAASADDAQEVSGGTVTINGTTIGASLDNAAEWVGLRFNNVTIPQGSTINTAILEVMPTGTGEDEPLVTIYCEDADDAAAFTTGASDISGRARTTASVAWSNTNLGADGATFFAAPDIKTAVQEVIDRVGWASGQDLVVLINSQGTANRDLTIAAWDGTAANAARLTISYTAPTGATGAIVAKTQTVKANLTGAMLPSGTIVAKTQTVKAVMSGHMVPSGAIIAALQEPVFSGTGTQTQTGTIIAKTQSPLFNATGAQTQTGTIAAQLQRVLANLTGIMLPSGVIAASLQAAIFNGTGVQIQTGSLAASLQPVKFAGEGTHGGAAITGTIAARLQAVGFSAVGAQTISGQIVAVLQSVLFAGTGTQTQVGALAATLQILSFNATGTQSISGVLAATLQPVEFSGSGHMAPSGILAALLQLVRFSGTGQQPVAVTELLRVFGLDESITRRFGLDEAVSKRQGLDEPVLQRRGLD